MNPAPSVIQFNCQSCGILLTVPASMAGVSGPCPHCGTTITSPTGAPPSVETNPFLSQPPIVATNLPAPPAPESPVLAGQSQPAPAAASSASGMTGAVWPPAAATATTASTAREPGAHPVMERLLHSQPSLPAATPPYQQRSSTPPRKRVSASRDKGRRGAMVLAILMLVLVLTGVSWFFRDQIRAVWLSYTLKDDESQVAVPPAPATKKEAESNAEGPDGSASASVSPKPGPSSSPSPARSEPQPDSSAASATGPAQDSPPVTVLPALPAGPATSPASTKKSAPSPSAPSAPANGLVEVSSPASPGPAAKELPTPPPAPALVTGITPESQPALEALQKFFAAKTWKERLPFVQAPTSMKPLMEQYYSANPDGPLHASHIQMIRHDKSPQTGPPHCVFQVSGGGLKQPLPIMVETTPDGWKVDWLTFTEFKDELLLKFLESPQSEPARFHVLMRRAHYFGDDVPALDKKSCFQVMPPMPGFTGDVFAIKGTSVSRDLDKFLGWDVSQAAAVVELQWRTDEKYKWVELTNLIQLNWRNVEPATGKTTAGGPTTKTSRAPDPPKAQAVE